MSLPTREQENNGEGSGEEALGTPEDELLDLQRRYKNMENERKIFAEET